MDSDSYFLACSRYIALNPVRVWMVAQPGDYPWSSYAVNAQNRVDSLLTPHARYLALGSDPAARASAYRALFSEALPDALVQDIRVSLQQQKVLGTDQVPLMGRSANGQVCQGTAHRKATAPFKLSLTAFVLTPFVEGFLVYHRNGMA